MEHARTQASPALRTPLGRPMTDRAWPFPPPPARGAVRPELQRATRELLAATARAWGLAEPAPRTPPGR